MPHDRPETQVTDTKVHSEIRTGLPPIGHQMQVGWVKIRHFRRKMRYNSKTVQDRRIVSIKVEQEVICTLSNGDVSDDLG